MIQANDSAHDPGPAASIEKAILADICLGYPLGGILFHSLPPAPLQPGLEPPGTYLFRGEQLAALKHAWRCGREEAVGAIEAILEVADKAMDTPPTSVTDKTVSRFSDDPQDYQSLAKYYWPDENSRDRAWVRRDGDVNPECYAPDFDYLRLVRFAENLTVLAMAAYLTDRAEYGSHATRMLQRWFIAPATRQNPHFEFAQVAPQGAATPFEGRRPGLIEARFLIYVTEAARLLESSSLLPQPIATGLREWFGQLLDWMLESELGRRAAQAANNIALWHGLQCMVYADFCGQGERAAAICKRIVPRLEHLVEPDGSLPSELARAYPQDYIAFSVVAMALISRAGEHHGVHLWDQQYTDGRSFQAAHKWLLQATHSSALLDLIQRGPPVAQAEPDTQQGDDPLDHALQLRSLERAMQTLAAQQDQLQREHDALASRTRQLARERDASERANAALSRYALGLEALVDKLLCSQSWRLTRPLRAILRVLRGAKAAETRSGLGPSRPEALAGFDTGAEGSAEAACPKRSPSRGLLARIVKAIAGYDRRTPEQHLTALRAARPRPRDEAALRAQYATSRLSEQPDTFVLYRIIGNDLHPRHAQGQSRENLRFVLENEPALPGCEKRWVVNRIVNSEEERRIIDLLEAHRQDYIHIPFVAEEYRSVGWDFGALPSPDYLETDEFRKLSAEEQDRARVAVYRLKNLYVMNNNGARNTALRDGRNRAKWVLPWDGNCFVTAEAWRDIVSDVTARPHLKYFAVPMERMLDNADLLREDYRPNPVEEPQLLFRCDAGEEFNEAFPYGRRPKVELFWRLGIPGKWERWPDDAWDQPRRKRSGEAGQFGAAGWVARMFSGVPTLESSNIQSFKQRGQIRQQAIISTLNHVSAEVAGLTEAASDPAFYPVALLDQLRRTLHEPANTLSKLLAQEIIAGAEALLEQSPFSVTHKTSLPPSGDPHDYWHPAPYWWPDPTKRDGLPYVWKDGERVPGTRMYEEDSDQYDRTRLQRMFDGTTTLALAWGISGRQEFADHAACFVRTWFLDPETRMNPHLQYAQVRRGHNGDNGSASGIIEFKDVYYFLDAVRLIRMSGALETEEIKGFEAWMRSYLDWLTNSPQGREEASAGNNHGTYYDLQQAAIALYLNDQALLFDIALRALSRIPAQIRQNGEQPEEMKRSQTQHYCFFNLQGWMNFLHLASTAGLIIPAPDQPPLDRIVSAYRWVMAHDLENWPHKQIEEFDIRRAWPLTLSAARLDFTNAALADDAKHVFNFHPHDGVHPFWNLSACEAEMSRVQ